MRPIPLPNVQFLPAFVALEKGFYKREGLDAELISVRNAVTAVQALLGNQIHFIFSVGPQMPSIWEGSDIILLAQQVGQPTFSMIVTPGGALTLFSAFTDLPVSSHCRPEPVVYKSANLILKRCGS